MPKPEKYRRQVNPLQMREIPKFFRKAMLKSRWLTVPTVALDVDFYSSLERHLAHYHLRSISFSRGG